MEGPKYGLAPHEDSTEYYDPPELLMTKVAELAALVRGKKTVVYTGAGLSTSAKIPDYRGPNGVWTLMDRGEAHKIQAINLEAAQPTGFSLPFFFFFPSPPLSLFLSFSPFFFLSFSHKNLNY